MIENYEWLKNIEKFNFASKKVLIIGGGEIAKQYALAFLKFHISDITIIVKTGDSISNFCIEKNLKLLKGGFEIHLSNLKKMDLVIIATPIPILINATQLCIDNGQDNILIEKPGSLYSKELLSLSIKTNSFNTRALSLQAVIFNLTHNKESLISLYRYHDLLRVEQISVSERYESIDEFNGELLAFLKNNVKMLSASPNKATTKGTQSRSINAIQDAVMIEMNALIGRAYETAVTGCQNLSNHVFSRGIPKNYKIESWAVNLRSGGFQLPHVHPSGWLSGCYYLKLPDRMGLDSNSPEGWLEFGRPEEKYGITDPLATYAYQPIEGEMVTFPSYFWHRTVPFLSDERRISIAFDIRPI